MKNLISIILLVPCSPVRGVMYLGFYKKIRNNNSIFLISQLHTNTSLGLCQTSMIDFSFEEQLTDI